MVALFLSVRTFNITDMAYRCHFGTQQVILQINNICNPSWEEYSSKFIFRNVTENNLFGCGFGVTVVPQVQLQAIKTYWLYIAKCAPLSFFLCVCSSKPRGEDPHIAAGAHPRPHPCLGLHDAAGILHPVSFSTPLGSRGRVGTRFHQDHPYVARGRSYVDLPHRGTVGSNAATICWPFVP